MNGNILNLKSEPVVATISYKNIRRTIPNKLVITSKAFVFSPSYIDAGSLHRQNKTSTLQSC